MQTARANGQTAAARRVRGLAWIACAAFAQTAAGAPRELQAGAALDVHLAAGEQASYRVTLAAGSAAELGLQQFDAMLQLRAAPEPGAAAHPLSTQAGRMARLHVSLLGDAATVWTIQINAAKADRAASYRIELTPARPATRADRTRALAETHFAEAEAIRLAAGGVEPGRRDADLAGARTLYGQAIDGWHEIHDACAQLAAGTGLARFELAQSRYPQAQAAAEAALAAECDASGDDLAAAADRAAALRTLAAARGYQGDFEASATQSEQALALYRHTGDERFQGVVLGNLSAVYRSLGETQRALEAAEEALAIAERTHDAQGVAFSRENIGSAYLARGELAQALAAYRRTLADLETTPYPLTEGLVWNELGQLYRRLGEAAQARSAWRSKSVV